MSKYSTTEEAKPDVNTVQKMGAIGMFGDVVFSVSPLKIFTFDDFERDTKGRWATHNVIGKTPISEFLGQDVESITLKIQLHVSFGVDPLIEYVKLLDMCRTGEVHFLIVGTHAHGRYKWYIENVKMAAKHFDGNGNILYCECNLTFKEYASG